MKNKKLMSTFISVFILFILCFLTGECIAAQKGFKIKSGIVEYKILSYTTGDPIGTETLYFDDHGKKMMWLREETTMYGNTPNLIKQMYLRLGNDIYMIDLKNMTAVKTTEEEFGKEDLKDIIERKIPERDDSFAEDFASRIYAEKEVLGTEVVLGRTCEVTKPSFYKHCAYQGVPLRVYSYPKGSVKKEAVRFEEDVVVPDEKFELPEGLTIQEGPNRRLIMEAMFSRPEDLKKKVPAAEEK